MKWWFNGTYVGTQVLEEAKQIESCLVVAQCGFYLVGVEAEHVARAGDGHQQTCCEHHEPPPLERLKGDALHVCPTDAAATSCCRKHHFFCLFLVSVGRIFQNTKTVAKKTIYIRASIKQKALLIFLQKKKKKNKKTQWKSWKIWLFLF